MAPTRKDEQVDSVPFLPLSKTRPSVKIYKCPRCVQIFTRKGLGVHFIKIHRRRLEDVYLDEEIDQAEVKVEKSMTEGGPKIDISLKRPSCELGKNTERVDFHAENKKTFKCSKCHREFYKVKSLKQHVTLMHSEEKFDCAYCQTKFKLESVMQRHQKICTKKKWKSKLESVIQIHQKKCSTKSGVNTKFSAKDTIINPNENEDENIKDFENVQTNQDFSCHLQTDITIKEEPIESVDIKNEPFLPYDNGIKIEVEES